VGCFTPRAACPYRAWLQLLHLLFIKTKNVTAHLNFWFRRALSGLVYTTRCLSLKAMAAAVISAVQNSKT
jgi:hypothetical protein